MTHQQRLDGLYSDFKRYSVRVSNITCEIATINSVNPTLLEGIRDLAKATGYLRGKQPSAQVLSETNVHHLLAGIFQNIRHLKRTHYEAKEKA